MEVRRAAQNHLRRRQSEKFFLAPPVQVADVNTSKSLSVGSNN